MVLGLDTALKKGIFTLYIILWVSSSLLVYRSKLPGAPVYNATSAVLLTEVVKLALALGFYRMHDGTFLEMARAFSGSLPHFARYAVPALLYCVYNNLVYKNLTYFDPGTYNMLMQLRIVLTGLIYQVLLSKNLNRNQWAAIVLITLGCMSKESGKLSSGVGGGIDSEVMRWWGLLICQMCCSVFAGVYNELLLKGLPSGANVTTNLNNAYMYIHSIIWNCAFLQLQGKLGEALSAANLAALASPNVVAIIAVMSSVGLVTGFFLSNLDSVLKAIAGSIEILLATFAAALFFAVPIDARTLVAAALVAGGVASYSRPPASSSAPRPQYSLLPTNSNQYSKG